MKLRLLGLFLPLAMLGAADVVKEVRHELVMLPYYGVFDNLAYRVDGSKVTLFGAVTQPKLKTDAANAVKKIEGVTAVDNEIEVLPASSSDDNIRRSVYRSIYSRPGFERYQFGAVPPIHIIVKNGNVTLEGVVDNEMDKNVAGITANGVSGIFNVKNNLVVQKSAAIRAPSDRDYDPRGGRRFPSIP